MIDLSKYELYLKQNLILLPIDQRYDIKEMKLILKITNNNN